MVVCVSVKHGLFLHINSRGPSGRDVLLPKTEQHPFLAHDSFIECSGLIELDDYTLAASVAASGVLGSVHRSLGAAIVAALDERGTVAPADLRRIAGALGVRWPTEGP